MLNVCTDGIFTKCVDFKTEIILIFLKVWLYLTYGEHFLEAHACCSWPELTILLCRGIIFIIMV